MKITLRTRENTHTFDCDAGDRILYAGLHAGLDLPYECATGTCGTCKAKSRQGTVEELWPEAPGRAYLKPERGEFLMCQAQLLAECEILVPGRPARGPEQTVKPVHRQGSISTVRRLTHDVIAFDVALDSPLSFAAGQFMVVEADGIPGFRAYSMCNFEPQAQQLSFAVKKKPGGAFSEWLFGPQAKGAPLRLFGPLGKAIFDPKENKDLLCIAGGSGIAGMMAMLHHACRAGYFEHHRGMIFFGVRTMRDAFFLQELTRFRTLTPSQLEITVALSDESAPEPSTTDFPALDYATGFVHQVAAQRLSGGLDNATVAFVAGPPPMVDSALRTLILEARLPADDIRYDKFS